MKKEKKEKKLKLTVVEYDDVLRLIQACTRYEQALADGNVTAETGRRFMRDIIKNFKGYLG